MQRIRAYWDRGWLGKVILISGGAFGLLVLCCVLLLIFVPSAPRTAQTATAAPAGASVQATEAPVPTALPAKPTDPPAPTQTSVSTATPAPTETPAPTTTPTPLPGIGTQVEVGAISWRVEEAREAGNTIESDNQFVDPLVTAGKFVRMSVAIQNQGDTEERISLSNFEIVDSQGRTFKAMTDFKAAMIIGNDNACVFQELPAGVPKLCQVIFEVPADASGFRFKATNLALVLVKEVLIDLGF